MSISPMRRGLEGGMLMQHVPDELKKRAGIDVLE